MAKGWASISLITESFKLFRLQTCKSALQHNSVSLYPDTLNVLWRNSRTFPLLDSKGAQSATAQLLQGRNPIRLHEAVFDFII